MSASRLSLLAAATLGSVLTPTAPCWAQAYGAATVVEQNDLRWFEPVELDIDGQMPHRDAGFFASYEKLSWAITGERHTIGSKETINEGEQIFRNNPDIITQAQVTTLAGALGPQPSPNPANPDATELAQIMQVLDVDFTGEFVLVDTGETTMIGEDEVPLLFVSPLIEPGSGNQPPPPILVQNGIQDALPDATFAWGERYELGYSDGERGWKIGILDGPEQNSTRVYGAGPGSEYRGQSNNGFANYDPFFGTDPVDLDQDGELDNVGDVLGDIFALGFGSVAVNFETPPEFFVGFRDYLINSFPAAGVVFGPIYEVPNYGGDEDGLLDSDVEVVGGIADDLNGNGFTFQAVLGDINGNGEIEDDEIIGSFTDYGDLYEFDIYFSDITVRNNTRLSGVELMSTHEINTGHKLEQGRSDDLQLSYGLRFLQMDDLFSWDARGSIIGRTGATVEIENQIIGPQIGLNWVRRDGPWDLVLDGRFTFGYNAIDRGLDGVFGQGAIPGGLNNAINARTTTTVIGDRQDDFSPLAELRIGARYRFSRSIALSVGYTGKFIDNIERASNAMRYTAPNFSLYDEGRSDVFVNGVNFGVEFRH